MTLSVGLAFDVIKILYLVNALPRLLFLIFLWCYFIFNGKFLFAAVIKPQTCSLVCWELFVRKLLSCLLNRSLCWKLQHVMCVYRDFSHLISRSRVDYV